MSSLVSIIIPVYNSEKYLRQCLDSVINQSWNNLQIICVDDGSIDLSWSILQEYAAKDKRLLIMTKQNEGVSLARNLALQYVQGEYITFLDSDDWLDSETIAYALESAKQYDADVVMWSYVREYSNKKIEKVIFHEDIVFDKKAVNEKLYRRMIGLYGEELRQPENMDVLCPACMKLYKSNIILENDITFYDIREIGTYEDGLFNLHYFAHVNKAVFLQQYFYHYRRDNIDSVTTIYKPNLPQQWDRLFEIMRDYIEKKKLDVMFQSALENRIAISIISLGLSEVECGESIFVIIKKIKAIINKRHYRVALKQLDLRCFPIHWKVFFVFAKMRCSVGIVSLLLIIQKIRGR